MAMANTVPIPRDTFKLGFIGAGKMAEIIANGVVKSGVLPASRIRTAHLRSDCRAAFEALGIQVFERNLEVVEYCDVIIFSVKPYMGAAINKYNNCIGAAMDASPMNNKNKRIK